MMGYLVDLSYSLSQHHRPKFGYAHSLAPLT